MPEHDRNERPVYSEWIPREADGGLDWAKVQDALRDVAAQETRLDADGRLWMSLRVLDQTGSDYVLFRLL